MLYLYLCLQLDLTVTKRYCETESSWDNAWNSQMTAVATEVLVEDHSTIVDQQMRNYCLRICCEFVEQPEFWVRLNWIHMIQVLMSAQTDAVC